MLRITIILLFFTANQLATAQSQPEIRPFMDYTNCYTGFRNAQGAQIWKPEFDWAQKLSKYDQKYGDYSFWMVKHKSGLVGLLDKEGKIILPFV